MAHNSLEEKMSAGISKKIWMKTIVMLALTMAMAGFTCTMRVYADTPEERVSVKNSCEDSQAADLTFTSRKSKDKAVYQIVARNGHKCWLRALNAEGSVKWSSSNKKVLKLLKKTMRNAK